LEKNVYNKDSVNSVMLEDSWIIISEKLS